MSNPKTHRLQLYRERHPRIDYYPTADVFAILLHHKNKVVDAMPGIIDELIRVGHRTIVSGNAKKS